MLYHSERFGAKVLPMSAVDDFLCCLAPGATVYVAGSCAEPRGLLDLVEANRDQLHDLCFIQQPLGAVNKRDLSALVRDSRQRSFFMAPQLQVGLDEGRIEFVPMHMRAIFDHLRNIRLDVALLQAARDQHGVLRFGPNLDYVDAVLASAAAVVIEENLDFVAPQTTPPVEESSVEVIVPCHGGVPTCPIAEPDGTSDKIGVLIADLINDGDCIQTGIGAVPAAILSNLKNKSDLGFHGGLMDDGFVRLIEAGNLTGSRKGLDQGKHVLGMALGSETMLDWLAHSKKASAVIFRGANYTHEATVICQLDNFVSINSAIEVDLMGQVNAEVAGGQQVSGTGGCVDFMRATKMSRGGRAIVAMSSTARRGSLSRIVPRVDIVTALRTDVDIVVTEFGVAALKDAPLAARRERLIAIAHPDFRDELRSAIT